MGITYKFKMVDFDNEAYINTLKLIIHIKILVYKFKMFLYFAFSIGIELNFTTVSYLLVLTLSIMTTKVNDMKNSVNMTNVLCVIGCGAQLERPTIPIARNEFISILD